MQFKPSYIIIIHGSPRMNIEQDLVQSFDVLSSGAHMDVYLIIKKLYLFMIKLHQWLVTTGQTLVR